MTRCSPVPGAPRRSCAQVRYQLLTFVRIPGGGVLHAAAAADHARAVQRAVRQRRRRHGIGHVEVQPVLRRRHRRLHRRLGHVHQPGQHRADPPRGGRAEALAGHAPAAVASTWPAPSACRSWSPPPASLLMLALGIAAYGVEIEPAKLPAMVVTFLVGVSSFAALGMAVAGAVPDGAERGRRGQRDHPADGVHLRHLRPARGPAALARHARRRAAAEAVRPELPGHASTRLSTRRRSRSVGWRSSPRGVPSASSLRCGGSSGSLPGRSDAATSPCRTDRLAREPDRWMHPELNEEHEALRKVVREFVAPRSSRTPRRGTATTRSRSTPCWRWASSGLFGIPFPEPYGGGGDLTGLCVAIEEVARVDQSMAITLEAGVGLGANPIYKFGTPEQQERWLPDLCAGRAPRRLRPDRARCRQRRRRDPDASARSTRRRGSG